MRTLIIFPLLVFIGFGYLLSDNFNTRQELGRLRQQNTQLIEANTRLRNEMDAVTAKLSEKEQIIAELTNQNLGQAHALRQLNEENVSLRQQINDLQTKIQILQQVSSLWGAFPKALRLAIFLPILPTSMLATYILVRNNMSRSRRTERNSQRAASVRLADHEVKEIIRMRRNR